MPEILILTLLSIVPIGGPIRESVDAVEVNFFHDDEGRLVFCQAIFKLWNGKSHDVSAWRLVGDSNYSGDGKLKALPERDHERGGYVMTWHDGNTLREVRTNSVDFSWTQWDVELIQREILPKEQRKELRGVQWDKPSGVIRPQPSRSRPQIEREL